MLLFDRNYATLYVATLDQMFEEAKGRNSGLFDSITGGREMHKNGLCNLTDLARIYLQRMSGTKASPTEEIHLKEGIGKELQAAIKTMLIRHKLVESTYKCRQANIEKILYPIESIIVHEEQLQMHVTAAGLYHTTKNKYLERQGELRRELLDIFISQIEERMR